MHKLQVDETNLRFKKAEFRKGRDNGLRQERDSGVARDMFKKRTERVRLNRVLLTQILEVDPTQPTRVGPAQITNHCTGVTILKRRDLLFSPYALLTRPAKITKLPLKNIFRTINF